MSLCIIVAATVRVTATVAVPPPNIFSRKCPRNHFGKKCFIIVQRFQEQKFFGENIFVRKIALSVTIAITVC
jgi:hypothetical protein